MDVNSKNGELKEFKIMLDFHPTREWKLSVTPEYSNLLGFRDNKMVFEEMASDMDESDKTIGKEIKTDEISKEGNEANDKKFLILNGKKFQIIKPNNCIFKSTLSSQISNKMGIKPTRKILPKLSTDTDKSTSAILNSVQTKQNIHAKPKGVIKGNPDLCKKVSKNNVKSEIFEIDGQSYKIQANHIKTTDKTVANSKRKTLNKFLKGLIESQGGKFKVVGSANMDTQCTPINPDYTLNTMSESDNSQLNVMTRLLLVPNPLESNGYLKTCNCNINKVLVSTHTNTEGLTVASKEVQTDEPFDYLLDSLWSQCLYAEKAESLITGRNVNMGIGPPSISAENSTSNKVDDAKSRFFLDLQKCLIWDSGNLPIHKGVIQKDLSLVRRQCVMLKARNAGVNIVNSSNFTPLQLAVIHNVSIEIVQALLSYEADMSILDPEGNNVLHLAVENNRKDLVEIFLDNLQNSSMNIDQFNYNGLTPLMLCAFDEDRVDMAENLLKMGAQPNLRDLKSGRTVMFHAAENHNTPIVSLLLDYSADTKIRNFFGTSIHDAVFELEDIPNEIKYPILGRDLKLHQRRKLNLQNGMRNADQLKRRKLQIVPTYQKIMSNTKFVVNNKN